jgi:hypothetical protein
MNPSDSSRELWQLFDAACDGCLSDDDVARLEQLLTINEHREQYLEYFELHAELYFRSCANRAERRGVVVAMANDDQGGGLMSDLNSAPGLPVPGNAHPSIMKQALSTVFFAALSRVQFHRCPVLATAILLVALTAWLFFGPQAEILPERDRQPIGTLVASGDAQWQAGLGPNKNCLLMEGQALQLLSGRAQISMSSGAELVFKSPCTIELKRPDLVDLTEGILSISLANWTKEFAITTEGVQIVDLGKQFVVSTDAKTSTVEAHAIEGKLRVLTTSDTATDSTGLLVLSGEAVRIDSATNASARLRANQQLFAAGISDAPPFKPLELTNTGLGLTPGSEDPRWVIINSSADDFTGPKLAVVCNPYRHRHLKNDPAKSQWISVGGPDYQVCPSNTMYTFETEVDLTGYDLSSLTVVAQVLADNGVMGVRINGERVEFKPKFGVRSPVFNAFHAIEIKHGFVEGVNKIQLDVWNDTSGTSSEAMNPMALRVEWQAFGRLKPSPKVVSLKGKMRIVSSERTN